MFIDGTALAAPAGVVLHLPSRFRRPLGRRHDVGQRRAALPHAAQGAAADLQHPPSTTSRSSSSSRRQLRPVLQPPIECTDRDAPFVLDGVLYHESDLDLEVGCLEQHGTAVGTGLLPVKVATTGLPPSSGNGTRCPFSPFFRPRPTSPPWVSCADSGRRSRPTGASRGFVLASTARAFVGAEGRAPRASRLGGARPWRSVGRSAPTLASAFCDAAVAAASSRTAPLLGRCGAPGSRRAAAWSVRSTGSPAAVPRANSGLPSWARTCSAAS